ncbi:glycerophosphodiester phosphodiesterase [Streptomyces rectiverticillatus]|uniref:glycerophosphodiester phosphodiesterase n=1 Tax=Streptomyces rectiverticillatus TaxID=173860 RepID=UPI0015C3147D|nr:glycerophosphodiester phosphodiesterase family protein [Streptomyces rectiverticillatus]QLE71587.1 glycerophosphodiester phosphodiesterase [Streptomyces rectiverticillatus]
MRIRPVSAVTSALLVLSTLVLTAPHARAAAPERAAAHTRVPLAIGHRGVPVQAPENTLASVDRAAELGITWVENDVQRTKDGALIVMHDTTLVRTTDVKRRFPGRAPWKIADFTLAEIRKLDAGRWYDRRFAGERVPTLRSYLQRVDRNKQKLLLEVKAPELYPGIERQLASELQRAGWLNARHVRSSLVVQSFSAASLKAFHRVRPDVKTGFLGAPKPSELRSYAAFADQINPHHRSVTAAWVRAVHALRGPHGRMLEVSAWTVDNGDRAVDLARMGVDGIISNAPHEIEDALEEDLDEQDEQDERNEEDEEGNGLSILSFLGL